MAPRDRAFTSKKRKANEPPVPPSSSTAPPLTSARLSKALDTLPRAAFLSLLSSSLLPAINALPSAQLDAINKAFNVSLGSLESMYDSYTQKLKKSMIREVNSNAEDESEILAATAGVVCDWLNDIFPVVIEQKRELALAHKSLVHMEASMKQAIDNYGWGQEEGGIHCYVYLSNTDPKKMAYNGEYSLMDVLLKFRRDLMLVALAAGDNEKDLVDAMLGSVGRKKKQLQMFVRKEGDTAYMDADMDDSWHDEDMKAALPPLRALLL